MLEQSTTLQRRALGMRTNLEPSETEFVVQLIASCFGPPRKIGELRKLHHVK
jgi:hypothetical protein